MSEFRHRVQQSFGAGQGREGREGRQGSQGRTVRAALASAVGRMFGADLRSLALLRIVLALLVLVNLVNRATNLRAHYSDDGVMPRSVALDAMSQWSWSLNFVNGSVAFQQGIFLLTGIAAIALLLGYHTRLMTIAVWILLSSIQVRNPLILSGGDLLLRMLLFWGMFVPLGAVWSLDRWRDRAAPRFTMRYASVGSAALFLQVAFMYWFTAALKTGPEWREDGSALFYVLRRPLYTTPVGEWLQQFTDLLQALSYATMGVEILAPILLFSPILSGKLRLAAIAALMGLHVGIMLTMSIGLFPWVSASSMLVFLPTSFWNVVEPWVRTSFHIQRARLRGMLAALEQSSQRVPETIHAGIARLNEGPGLSYSTQSPHADGDGSQRGAAPIAESGPSRNSGEGDGSRDAHEAGPSLNVLKASPLLNALAASLVLFVFCWNMTTVSAFTMPAISQPIAYTLNIQQNWVMFAPGPPRFNTRYVLQGTLRDGQQIELLRPVVYDDVQTVEPFTLDPPAAFDPGHYKDMHWRLYLARLGSSSKAQRVAFAEYACGAWNDRHDGAMAVRSLVYIYIVEDILPDGSRSEERTLDFGPYSCG